MPCNALNAGMFMLQFLYLIPSPSGIANLSWAFLTLGQRAPSMQAALARAAVVQKVTAIMLLGINVSMLLRMTPVVLCLLSSSSQYKGGLDAQHLGYYCRGSYGRETLFKSRMLAALVRAAPEG
eukprot:1113508-Pelagomonas_calceolata.AAC.3